MSHGDARGELMVVQCRLAEGASGAEEKKLRTSEKKLVKALEKTLALPIAERLGYPASYVDALTLRVEIDRGFVSSLLAPADVLLKLDTVFEVAPLVTELRFSAIPPFDKMTELDASYFESPLLARLRRLVVGVPGNGDPLLRLVAACPHLSNLTALAFNGSRWWDALGLTTSHRLTAGGVSVLAASPHFRGLTELTFDDDHLGDDGIAELADGPWKLEALSVANNGATGASLEALARAKSHRGLRRLTLRGLERTEPAQIAALVSAKHLASLVALDVEHCALGTRGFEAMLAALDLPALEELIAASNEAGEEGAEHVATSTKLAKLKVLDLTKNGFNKKGIQAIAKGNPLAVGGKVLLNERDSDDARKALASSSALAKTTTYFRGKLIAKAK